MLIIFKVLFQISLEDPRKVRENLGQESCRMDRESNSVPPYYEAEPLKCSTQVFRT